MNTTTNKTKANGFTEFEMEVLHKLCLSNTEICNELNINIYLCKNTIINIFKKLGVANRESALVRAIQMGVLNAYSIPIAVRYKEKHDRSK